MTDSDPRSLASDRPGGWGWLLLPIVVMVVGSNIWFGVFFASTGDVRSAARLSLAYGPLAWSLNQLALLGLAAWRLRRSGVRWTSLIRGPERESWKRDVGIGLLGALAASAVILAVQSLQGVAGGSPGWPRWVLVYWTLVTSITAGVGEEVYFRGFLFHRLGRLSRIPLLLTTSVAFAAWHVSPGMFAHTFLVGLLFAAMYAATGRLLPAIVAHAGADVIGGVGMLAGWW